MNDMYSVIAAVASAFFAGIAAYQTYKGHKRNSIENGAPRIQIRNIYFSDRVLIKSNGTNKYNKSLIEVEIENLGDVVSPKCFIFITIPNEIKDKYYISKPLYSFKETHLETFLVDSDCHRKNVLISVVAQDMFENLFVYDSHISLNNKHLYTFNSKPVMVDKIWNRKYYNKIVNHMKSAYENKRFLSGIVVEELAIFESLINCKNGDNVFSDLLQAEESSGLEEIKAKEKYLVKELNEMSHIDVDIENYEIL